MVVLYISLLFISILTAIGYYQRRRYRTLQAEVNKLAQEKDQWIIRETQRITFTAQEEERKRISQDLHDELGSLLTAIKLNLELVEKQSIFILHSVDALKEVKYSLSHAINVVKYTSRQTSPSYIGKFGLTSAIKQIANSFNRSCSSRVQVLESGVPIQLNKEKELHLYRMVQEIVSNSVNNTSAWKIDIKLHWEEGCVTVEIMDDGIAHRSEKLYKPLAGMGLSNIASRAELIGATVCMPEMPRGNHSIIKLKYEEFLQDQYLPG